MAAVPECAVPTDPHAEAEFPEPGSAGELAAFAALQGRLPGLFGRVFPDPLAPQTIVVLPGLTLDRAEIAKLKGAPHYEERLLCLLMLLRRPRTHVVYVTSRPLDPTIVDYYLHLLPGVPLSHARRRLTLLACQDAGDRTLAEKVLARPRLIERIRGAIPDAQAAHLTCFNATPLERTLAVRLGIPLYACDPSLAWIGTKSGSRTLFRRAGVALPDGVEGLRDAHDLVRALAELKRRQPELARAVVKLNDGFSGEGNALVSFDGSPAGPGLERWLRAELPARMRFEAAGESWERFREKLGRMGGIAECWLEGPEVRSPSVQCRIDPLGGISIISTHDQVLGGPSGQIFVGCTFPADPAYCGAIQAMALRAAEALRGEGVIGRFSIDFVCRRRADGWEVAALEVNLRKGGTTHPFLTLQYLTDGEYDPQRGCYESLTGRPCFYHASDNLKDPAYRGLSPDDLLEIAVENGLYWDAAAQQGVVFHLIGALSEFGKLGTVCIGDTPRAAARLYHETVAVLDRATHAHAAPAADAVAPAIHANGKVAFAPGILGIFGAHGPAAQAAQG
ncbi:MAG TPA: peptide ligase PGM1-related protein [Longimicrobium sp.]|nr:peptide ligase PGM1-related protein [Longimicrobium sp.]